MLINGQKMKYDDVFEIITAGEIAGNEGKMELAFSKFAEAHKLFLSYSDNGGTTTEGRIVLWNIFNGIGICYANIGDKENALYHFNQALMIAPIELLKEKTKNSLNIVNKNL